MRDIYGPQKKVLSNHSIQIVLTYFNSWLHHLRKNTKKSSLFPTLSEKMIKGSDNIRLNGFCRLLTLYTRLVETSV